MTSAHRLNYKYQQHGSTTNLPKITPTLLSRYVTLAKCERFLWLNLRSSERKQIERLLNVEEQPISSILSEAGTNFEKEVVAQLQSKFRLINLNNKSADETVEALRNLSFNEEVLFTQAELVGKIGKWDCEGRCDLILARRIPDPKLGDCFYLMVADIKSGRKERLEYRLQVAFYVQLLSNMLKDAGVKNCRFAGKVLLKQPDGSIPELKGKKNYIELPILKLILDQLLVEDDSNFRQTIDVPTFEQTSYSLNPKCGGCTFNQLCLAESQRKQDLTLVPFIDAASVSALRTAGVNTLSELASLKILPPPNAYNTSFQVTLGKEKQVEVIKNSSATLSVRLDHLVQRARSRLKQFDSTVEAYPHFLDSKWPSLPSDKTNPNLVKVFIDAQLDYVQDRLYLVGALVVGPRGSIPIIEICNEPPETEEAEFEILERFLLDVLTATAAVAFSPNEIPIHIYVFDAREQEIWLDALGRHMARMTAVPVLFDLLTASPALNQSMLGVLSKEIREHRNIGITCQNLYNIATIMGFKWQEAQPSNLQQVQVSAGNNSVNTSTKLDFTRLFHQQVFDNNYQRNDGIWVQKAARFSSIIPLEYAYGAWKKLPQKQGFDNFPYNRVELNDLKAFQEARLRAMAFIEERIGETNKDKRLQKVPLDINRIVRNLSASANSSLGQNVPTNTLNSAANTATNANSLEIALQEFLLIEHYTAVQEKNTLYAMPIEHRIQTGEALLLKCVRARTVGSNVFVTFEIAYDVVSQNNINKQQLRQTLRLKEGDWLVLNNYLDKTVLATNASNSNGNNNSNSNQGNGFNNKFSTLSPNQIKYGRIVLLNSLNDKSLELKLMGLNDPKSKFKYGHDYRLNPVPGNFYTLDLMADDLNADKCMEAIMYSNGNAFFQYLASPIPPKSDATIVPEGQQFLQVVSQIGQDKPTDKQREIIGGYHYNTPVLTIQGPPGTGKTATLGWAILARIFAARYQNTSPVRVVVCAHTHKATNLILESVAKKLKQLSSTGSPLYTIIGELKILKTGGGDGGEAEVPEGVEFLDPYYNRQGAVEVVAGNRASIVIGSTPGGIYTLINNYSNKNLDWHNLKPFDLLIIDEASQMSLPQAVLAAAWLKPQGQILVVGDHRQMPPILAHDWDRERNRNATVFQPFLSVFETLKERNFPSTFLDESFRLHRIQAEFLQQNIYKNDNITFKSKQTHQLSHLPSTFQVGGSFNSNKNITDYCHLALHPDYPIVVIEHDEVGSQQFNLLEIELVAPLIEAVQNGLGLDGQNGIGVVVPHNAQKAALRSRFSELAKAQAIDTVERFQGGERDVIIVSATASDPDYVLAESDFLLNLNRLNVAISRPRKKLIVIASKSLFQFLSSDVELFENAVLWRKLRYLWAKESLWQNNWQLQSQTQQQIMPKEFKVKMFGRRHDAVYQ